jgi:hypothetical protein
MKNYEEVEQGVYQSINTVTERKVDDKRIREIIRDKAPRSPQANRKLAASFRPLEALR